MRIAVPAGLSHARQENRPMPECPPSPWAPIDQQSINTIRALCMDAVQAANSGHPGAPLGLAPAAYVLWTRLLKHHPANPAWLDRDRFVLSGGHASTLLYSLLFLTGYGLNLEDLKQFRQWGSRTPGHPEYLHTPGVETTTGPLGQGFANAVGMAMAERHLAARFNRPGFDLVDHATYVICGDGDLMEGVTYEAASLAGHLGLGRLIAIYDDNRITIEGSTTIAFTEDVAQRFAACGWQVLRVDDGNDLGAIETALRQARTELDQPTLIMLRTDIAFGSPNKQNTAEAHGAPLGTEEVVLTKRCLGCPEHEQFCVPPEVLVHCRRSLERGEQAEADWLERFRAYRQAHPDLAAQWVDAMSGFLPNGWERALPEFSPTAGAVATRSASGRVLNALAPQLPTLMGGSADLAPSTNTFLKGYAEFQKQSYEGRNIRFGVREHAMGAILSGLLLHHGLRPYGGTFLVFADYMRPAIRMASLMKLPVIYVFTHDSLAVGEDGPTHQPVEQLASLRAIPGLTVIRPCDARETVGAWCQALRTSDGPVALILSRQNLPVLAQSRPEAVAEGAYILEEDPGPLDALLIATGSEVHLALAARKLLAERGIRTRVVSMPSWELFDKQPSHQRDALLPPTLTCRVAIEAAMPMGWERYVGDQGAVIGMTGFGASAPGGEALQRFGFTAQAVVARVCSLLGR
jgi:transketolase